MTNRISQIGFVLTFWCVLYNLVAKNWTPPIGIPALEFGIEETHYMYKDKKFNFGSKSMPYKDSGNGPYHSS